jgi:RNA polymerase sigma-70 factor, ECF subfamily
MAQQQTVWVLGRRGQHREVGRNPDGYSIASEDELLMTAQSGDQQAFVELCLQHSPMVKKRIFSIVRNQEDAEDALQDTLLRADRHLEVFRHTCKFSTWLTSIGTNTALTILRKRKTSKQRHTDLLNDESGPWEAMEHVDLSPDPERLHSSLRAPSATTQHEITEWPEALTE